MAARRSKVAVRKNKKEPLSSARLSRTRKQFVPFSAAAETAKKAAKKKVEVKKTKPAKAAGDEKGKKVAKVAHGKLSKVKGGRVIKKTKKVKKEEPEKVRKIGNDRLVPRDGVEQWKENPFYFGKTTPEYVSASTLHRLAFRALKRGDFKEFKKLISQKNFTRGYLYRTFSHGIVDSPHSIVMMSKNAKLIDDYIKELTKLDKEDTNLVEEPNLLRRRTTGRRNFYMLGRATRQVQMSRGGKEGNNALIDYEWHPNFDKDEGDVAKRLARDGVEFAMLDKLRSNDESGVISQPGDVVDAVRFGQLDTASHIIKLLSNWDVNELHKITLSSGKLPKRILPVSIRKKAQLNRNITPVHTAAINPNVEYLKAFREVEPNVNMLDIDNWSTVHYAAVCSGTAPLKYLISLGTSLLLRNKREETPLHCAARAGRLDNVKVILEWIDKYEKSQGGKDDVVKEEEDEEEEPSAKRAKKAKVTPSAVVVNYKDRSGRTALHLAVKYGRYDVVRHLLKHPKVDVAAQTGATNKKLSPLAVACQTGQLEIAKLLIEEGKALVESKDKLHRSPLLHAVMNGQDHVIAYLLKMGANLHKPDSSGNSPAHYAAAYGFLSSLKMLCEIDPTVLDAHNDWLLTPLSVAFLKGHYGIVSWMLDGKYSTHVNINCKDNEGVTLIGSLLSYFDENFTQSLPEQIKFLIDRGADCSLEDSTGNTPLHIFAALKIPLCEKLAKDDNKRLTLQQYEECVDMLLKANASIEAKNSESATPFQIAISTGNLLLAELLFARTKDTAALINSWPKDSNVLADLFAIPLKVLDTSFWPSEKGPLKQQFAIGNLVNSILKTDALKAKEWLAHTFTDNTGTPVTRLASNYLQLTGKTGDSIAKSIAVVALQTLESVLDFAPECLNQTEEVCRRHEVSLIHLAVIGSLNSQRLLDLILARSNACNRLLDLLCIRNAELRTPLQAAINLANEDTCKKLLVTARDNGCVDKVHNAIYQEWIELDEKPLSVHKSILHLLVEKEMVDAVDSLQLTEDEWKLTDCDPSIVLSRREVFGNSAFHYACRTLNNKTSQLLKKLRLPEETGHHGMSPLHVAVDAERTNSADAFVDNIDYVMHLVDVNARDSKGRTALHYAFMKSSGDSKSPCDPIAVVSLLLSKMSSDAICAVDHDGNTALHLAAIRDANICAVTLMNHGCEVNIPNIEGNTPLGLAVLNKCAQTALTLIQAHSDIHKKVFGPEPAKNESSEWAWFEEVMPPAVRLEATVPGLVVKNEWHSMVYVILDLLEKTPSTVAELARAALVNGQHNFALYLLKLLSSAVSLFNGSGRQADFESVNLLKAFVDGLKGPLDTSALNVMSALLALGLQWVDVNGTSDIIEAACRCGMWTLVEELKTRSADGQTQWARLSTEGKAKALGGLVEKWVESGGNDELRRGIAALGESSVFKVNVPYPKTALVGLPKSRNPAEIQNCSPMLRAIQAHQPALIVYLQSVGCPVPVDALLHAVATNQRSVVKAVCEGILEKPLITPQDSEKKQNSQRGRPGVQLFATPMRTAFVAMKTHGSAPRTAMPSSRAQKRSHQASNGWAKLVNSDSGSDEETDASESGNDSEEEKEETEGEQKKWPKLTLKPKNQIYLAFTDSNGRNVFHYLVEPVGWENVELLNALVGIDPRTAKTLLHQADGNGFSPMKLAAKKHQRKILAEMNKLGGAPTEPSKLFPPHDVSALVSKYDIDEDAKHFLAKYVDEKKQEALRKPEDRTPHANSEYEKTGEIVRDEDTGQLFKVLLNKTDLQYGLYGFHNFYRMELIKRKDCELYVLFTNWGRIGDRSGEHQSTPFTQLDKAVKEFKTIFRQKCGQDWCDVDEFQEINSKYRLVKTNPVKVRLHRLPIDLHSHETGDTVYNFVKDISSVRSLGKYAKSVRLTMNVTVGCPLGEVTHEDIEKARGILQQLKDLNSGIQKIRDKKEVSVEKLLAALNRQRRLSADFYSCIPVGGFEQSALPILDQPQNIGEAEKALNKMEEIEIATRVLCAATWRKTECESIRYIQYALECDFRSLSPQEPFAQRILQFIRQSSKAKVLGVLEVTSKHACEKYEPHINEENQKYLWHGTKSVNLISILKHGFMSEPNALQCGQAFGKGIYFADAFAKSEGYCQASNTGVNYMMLCQIAPGKVYEGSEEPKQLNFDSRYIPGTSGPDPKFGINFDGVTLPCGPLVNQESSSPWGSNWSEYVVREEERTMPRYVVMWRN